MHLYVDADIPLDELVIFGLLFVLFCVWTVALTRAWRARHQ